MPKKRTATPSLKLRAAHRSDGEKLREDILALLDQNDASSDAQSLTIDVAALAQLNTSTLQILLSAKLSEPKLVYRGFTTEMRATLERSGLESLMSEGQTNE